MKTSMLIPVLISFLSTHAVAGGYDCTFTTSCYGSDGCDSDRLFIVKIDNGENNRPKMILPGATISAVRQADENPGIVSGTISYVSDLSLNNVRLLTIYSNGSALFSNHSFLSDAFSIESRGTCERN